MKDEFWDTEPHYGGDRGAHMTQPLSGTACRWMNDAAASASLLLLFRARTQAMPRWLPTCATLNLTCRYPPRPCPRSPAVIWDALRAACEADLETARIILDSAGVIVAAADMTICYDERGRKYELPRYVISPPSNLQRYSRDGSKGGGGAQRAASGGRGQLELPAVAAGAGSGSPASLPDSASLPDDAPLNQVAVR